MKGFIEVYTGDGKGKTTASIGLAIRAIGAGDEEIKAWGDKLVVYPAGHPPKDYRNMVLKGIDDAMKAVSGSYDVVILDEYNMACWYELATDADTKRILSARKENVELVFTGRNAPEAVLDAADLITEMKKVRHYYDKGIMGRKGIEN